jgi:DNA-binding response OmpR family regulator
MTILLIEDEQALAEAVSALLIKENFKVEIRADGVTGLDEALTDRYDLILLDIMLPGLNGLNVLKQLREDGIKTPVLMLTAKGEIMDKVLGLDLGADDYLPKPFAREELMARVRALLRRKDDLISIDALFFGDLLLSPSTLTLTKAEKMVKLSPKECDVMSFLFLRKGLFASKEMIIEKLWGYDSEADDNHVEVYISFLRKKLIFLKSEVVIKTMRGVGYALEEQKHV